MGFSVCSRRFQYQRLTSKGDISRAVSRLTSHGVADLDDPLIMEQLRRKHPPRRFDLPDKVKFSQPVTDLGGLRENWLQLVRGVAPGSGGMRPEFLTVLACVWSETEMKMM